MPRKPRETYLGATFHVFVHAVARTNVAEDADDFERALHLLERTVSRYELECHAWACLPNHTHLLVTTPLGNISGAMRWFGSNTAQAFNRRHERKGHLYKGRFESRVVEDDRYLLELARYLPLNPVRAGLCSSAEAWPWSSYSATAGLVPRPWLLTPGAFLEQLGSTDAYAEWVAGGMRATYLDERGVPHPPAHPPLSKLLRQDTDRAIALAHFRHGYSQTAIARHLGVSQAQISRRLALHR